MGVGGLFVVILNRPFHIKVPPTSNLETIPGVMRLITPMDGNVCYILGNYRSLLFKSVPIEHTSPTVIEMDLDLVCSEV
ncbi:hypothetical protein Y032_1133g3664 [Ancylostoma ceylanicum]|uniref:Uncharacterized protein n=1 Tax=Ancylostoma ceylanicum TaxID=53326 RepID=A0A016W693_9BILA|nr:hypothetical protein Y032_1133g3664 [Ancylostoma ceylanicum]